MYECLSKYTYIGYKIITIGTGCAQNLSRVLGISKTAQNLKKYIEFWNLWNLIHPIIIIFSLKKITLVLTILSALQDSFEARKRLSSDTLFKVCTDKKMFYFY